MFFFFSTERAAPGPPAGGATLLGWPNYGWAVDEGGWPIEQGLSINNYPYLAQH
jgi:hypothetical protein